MQVENTDILVLDRTIANFLNRYSCPGFLEFINSEKEYNNQISSKEKKKISNKDNRKN